MNEFISEFIENCQQYHEKRNISSDCSLIYDSMESLDIFVANHMKQKVYSTSNIMLKYDNAINELSFQISKWIRENILTFTFEHEFRISLEEDVLKGNTYDEKKIYFIYTLTDDPQWIKYYFSKYVKLPSALRNIIENITSNVLKLLYDYSKECKIIFNKQNQTNFLISKIELFHGDMHRNNKFVCKVFLSNGSILYYKFRNSSNETFFQKYICFLNRLGFNCKVGIPEYLDFDDHSWCFHIDEEEISNIKDLPKFYYNYGKITAVFYTLGTVDIIPDNVVIKNDIPFFIDLEMLFHRNNSFKESPCLSSYYDRSVLRSGILPRLIYGGKQRNVLLSSLHKFSFPKRMENQQPDSYDTKKNNGSKEDLLNSHLPKKKGYSFPIDEKTSKMFINGFEDGYNFMVNNKEKLLSFFNSREGSVPTCGRTLLHQTLLYSRLLRDCKIPEVLAGVETIDRQLELLVKNDVLIDDYNKKAVKESLYNQLMAFDIPLFVHHYRENIISDAYSEEIISYPQLPKNTILEQIVDCIQNLSTQDLEIQKDIVIKSLKYAENILFGKPHFDIIQNWEITEDNKLYDGAVYIGEYLYSRLIKKGDEYNWICKCRNPQDGVYDIMPIPRGLYDGIDGLCLFYYYLYKVTNKTKYRVLSLSIYNNLKSDFYVMCERGFFEKMSNEEMADYDVSPYSFPGSLLYIMQRGPTSFFDKELSNKILRVLNKIIKHNCKYDYLTGQSGLLDFLLKYGETFSDDYVLENINILLTQICNNAVLGNQGSEYWIYNDTVGNKKFALGGFAHGTSGIAYSLLNAYKAYDNEEYYSHACKALNYDNSLFDERLQGWKDLRSLDVAYDSCSWCHGASGICLSRILIKKLLNSHDSQLETDINVSTKKLLEYKYGHNQSICHGDMGNLEILLLVGNDREMKKLKKIANDKAQAIAKHVLKGGELVCGDESIMMQYNLFTGIAGVGYQFLRLYDLKTVPSLLYF